MSRPLSPEDQAALRHLAEDIGIERFEELLGRWFIEGYREGRSHETTADTGRPRSSLRSAGSACALTGNVAGHEVVAYFDDVGDLVIGGMVQVDDVEVGLVKKIELVTSDGRMMAKVTMAISAYEERVCERRLTAVIRQTSLLGEQFVDLEPERAGAALTSRKPGWRSRSRTRTGASTSRRSSSDLSGFVGEGGIEDLNRFTHAQALILEDRGARLGKTFDELALFTDILANRRFDIAGAIDHLASAGSTLAANQATLDSFLDSLAEANVLLADQGDELGRLFSSLQSFRLGQRPFPRAARERDQPAVQSPCARLPCPRGGRGRASDRHQLNCARSSSCSPRAWVGDRATRGPATTCRSRRSCARRSRTATRKVRRATCPVRAHDDVPRPRSPSTWLSSPSSRSGWSPGCSWSWSAAASSTSPSP